MNDTTFAQELAAVLATGSDYAALAAAFGKTDSLPAHIYGAQQSVDEARPQLVVSGDWEAYGLARKGTLTLELRGRQGDETADHEHQTRVIAVLSALLGAPAVDPATAQANRDAAKATLKAALAARTKVALIDYGPAPTLLEADADGDDLRTALMFRAVWKFTPSV